MFTKRRDRKQALERIKKIQKEVNTPLNPTKHAYKQQQLVFETAKILQMVLENKI